MVKISTVLRTFISRFLFIILIILALPAIILLMILPERMRYHNRPLFWGIDLVCWGFVRILRMCFIPISYEGYDQESGTKTKYELTAAQTLHKGPVIFIANHQSAMDAPLLGVLARGRPHIWIARQELMSWKLLRWVLPRLSIVFDVTSRQKAMGSLLRLVRLVQGTDIDIMIFPEGARYSDDKVHKFYGGFSALAKLLKRPVVPVFISGVNKVYPPDTFWVFKHPINVTVGKPFEFQDNETDDEFKERVRQWFVDQSES